MATHSKILLAQKIPWTEEPGGLQSMELQKSRTITSLRTLFLNTVTWIRATYKTSFNINYFLKVLFPNTVTF